MNNTRSVRRRAGRAHRSWLAAKTKPWRNWGASGAERATMLPGDELVREPAEVCTMAVTVGAPAAEVWRWLVQIGQDRGGMYSYDWLENIVGLRVHSADHIEPRWQRLTAGDEVRLVRRGWLGMRDGYALPVARLVPGRSVVLRQRPPEHPWDGVWSFHVLPLDRGRCRLLARTRTALRRGPTRVASEAMWPVTFAMTRKMLLGIKERAERRSEEADRAVAFPSSPSRRKAA